MVANAGVPVVRVAKAHTAAGIIDRVRCVAGALGVSAAAAPLVQELMATDAALTRGSPDAAARC